VLAARAAQAQQICGVADGGEHTEDNAGAVGRIELRPVQPDEHEQPRHRDRNGNQETPRRALAKDQNAGRRHEEHLKISEDGRKSGTHVMDGSMPEVDVGRECGAAQEHPAQIVPSAPERIAARERNREERNGAEEIAIDTGGGWSDVGNLHEHSGKTDEEASVEEKNIMKGIVKFGAITVKQIMRSRLEVNGINYNSSFDELIRKVERLHYSRLPVYKESLDEVTGIINTKDLIPFLEEAENFDWHPLMRQPYFVPESKLISDLLRDFQSRRVHFAVVVDEFGGTSGIVTMEDIIEEVIGDIKDEFDEEETQNLRQDDNNYIFEGKTMIHDTCKLMHLPMDTFDKVKGESESLGGLVLELAGEFPKVNDVIKSGDFDFTVMETDRNRIKLVKVTIQKKSS